MIVLSFFLDQNLCCDSLKMQMMIYGGIFGCLSPILSISAFLSHKSPFVYPKDEVPLSIPLKRCLLLLLNQILNLHYGSVFLSAYFQRQNVERAKLALLTDKLDGPSNSFDVDRQSDHLLMMIAYMKWEKILREVDYVFFTWINDVQ